MKKEGTNLFKKMFGFIDLTKGSPLKVMLIFSIPLIISTVLSSSLSLFNSQVLKYTVGGNSVTAMNQTSSLSMILFQFAFGCGGGFAILLGQKLGANDQEGLKKVFKCSVYLTIGICLLITIIGVILLKDLLIWLNVPEIYRDLAYKYFIVLLIGFVFNGLYNLFAGFLRALGNSFFPLVISAIITVLTIGMNFLFTSKQIFNLDTMGCAISNVIAQVIGTFSCLIYLFKKMPLFKERIPLKSIEKDIYFDLLKLGLPLGFQWSILFIGSFVVQGQINIYGADAAKAVASYSSWEGYLCIPFNVISTALCTFVGQNYGAKRFDRIRLGFRDSTILTLIFYVIVLAIGLPTIGYVPRIFLPANEINDRIIFYTQTYLVIIIPMLIFQGLLKNFRSVLQGVKRAMLPFLSGVGELVARILISLLVPYLVDNAYRTTHSDASYWGLCFSTPAAWIVSFIIMGVATFIILYNNKIGLKKEEMLESKTKQLA